MSTIRVSKDSNYSCINNQPLQDVRLSWAARGLLVFLLSKPDDWTVSVEHLVTQGPTGKKGIWTLLRELESHGYLLRSKHRNNQGRWGWQHVLYEIPQKLPRTEENPNKPPYTPSRCMDERCTVKGGIYQVLSNQVLKEPPLPPATPPPPEHSNGKPIQPVPPFNSVDFMAALHDFREHRKEIKEPLTARAEEILFRKLAKWGEPTAIEALENAVLNRWRGVFEPKSFSVNGNRPPSNPNLPSRDAEGRAKLVV